MVPRSENIQQPVSPLFASITDLVAPFSSRQHQIVPKQIWGLHSLDEYIGQASQDMSHLRILLLALLPVVYLSYLSREIYIRGQGYSKVGAYGSR